MKETPEERSRIMRAVKGQNTAPEMTVRRLAHAMGYRFRLHRKDLPGKPDLVFPRLRKVLFVHGCFWHGHGCARGARVPVQNRDYWTAKIARNKERDARARGALKALGWSSLALWECELKDGGAIKKIIERFLGRAGAGELRVKSEPGRRPARVGKAKHLEEWRSIAVPSNP